MANPFAKQPNPTMKNNLDWTELDLEALPADFIPRTSYQPVGNPLEYEKAYPETSYSGKKREQFRLAWRRMASVTGQRTLHATVIPPGTSHLFTLRSVSSEIEDQSRTLELLGIFSSIPSDYFVKTSAVADLTESFIKCLPMAQEHLLAPDLILRAARLICLTETYRCLWESTIREPWSPAKTYRNSGSRRAALVEIDALVALMFGLNADELCTIYRTQFPVLRGYELNDLYDSNGRKVPGEINKLYRQRGETLSVDERTWTHPQSKVEYVFEFPFQSFDREEDMRKAYTHFEQLLADKQAEELVK